MYNTCFYLALRPPFFAQQYSCSEKTTLFSEQVLQAAELPHWEASFAASGGNKRWTQGRKRAVWRPNKSAFRHWQAGRRSE